MNPTSDPRYKEAEEAFATIEAKLQSLEKRVELLDVTYTFDGVTRKISQCNEPLDNQQNKQ